MTDEFLRWLLPIVAAAVISTVVPWLVNSTIKKSLKNQELLKQLEAKKEEEKRTAQLEKLLNEKLDPIKSEVNIIKEEVTKNKDGTVTLLRERMEQSHDRFIREKCISAGELANWRHLYNTYEWLGGNHFKEYVDEWKTDIETLPRDVDNKKE